MKTAVILPAAGASRRFQRRLEPGRSKLELELAGKPVLLHAVELFLQHEEVEQILLAVSPERVDEFELRYGDKLRFLGVDLVAGGERERWETVARALKEVREPCTHVAVHDAARPVASRGLIDRVLTAGYHCDAVVPGVEVTHTLKRVEATEAPDAGRVDPMDAILGDAGRECLPLRRVTGTVDRRDVVQVQTPQLFERGLLERAYARVESGEVEVEGITDDAGLVEAMGASVYVVEGEATNLKLTHPEDAELAAAWLEKREADQAAEHARRVLPEDEDEI